MIQFWLNNLQSSVLLKKLLSWLKRQIASMEDRIKVIELKLDEMNQKTLIDYFYNLFLVV